jgi:thiamine biosynthesis lipoprotein
VSGPATPFPVGTVAVSLARRRTETFRSMASEVTLMLVDPGPRADDALEAAQQVFRDVEAACTRFDPASPLMRANARPEEWHQVPAACFDALLAAHRAHLATDGLFDPRVLRTLTALGYDRSLPFAAGNVSVPGAAGSADLPDVPGEPAAPRVRWQPGFDESTSSVRIGSEPVDLGGIGKGLAVHWAAQVLAGAGRGLLVEAGGDCEVAGSGPDGERWLVGVEDPAGAPGGGADEDPVAVLAVRDAACATSSTRVRSWRAAGRAVHHLIDPRTGEPGGTGLRSVTVVGADAATAETWSKALFLAGSAGIGTAVEQRGLAALWVTDRGTLGCSAAAEPFVVWRAAA